MAGVIDAIGLVGTILTTIGFAQSNLPNSSPSGAVIGVKVGLQDTNDQNFGGRIAKIQGFDANNAKIGEVSPDSDIASGDKAEYTLDQSVGGVQTQYATFIGSDGAICISWLTLKNLDGAADAAWTGDVSRYCGHSWYMGNQVAGTNPDGSRYSPACAWLDADHTNDLDTGAFKIDFFAYGEQLKDTLDSNAACSKTSFSYDAAEIDGVPQKKKRTMVGKARPAWMEKRLVVSENPSHNVTELCQDEMSWGPDAVGPDGYYCNMATRELLPLCSTQDVEGCVNVDKDNHVVTKRSSVAKRSTNLHYRSYEKLDMYQVD